MAKFIQIIEFETSRLDEVQTLSNEMDSRRQGGTVETITVTADRDRPNHYRTVATFDSYESAMQNSQRPETQEFARSMAELCDAPPTFHNLDVIWEWARQG
jgi:quinol monooxygenase YgiN